MKMADSIVVGPCHLRLLMPKVLFDNIKLNHENVPRFLLEFVNSFEEFVIFGFASGKNVLTFARCGGPHWVFLHNVLAITIAIVVLLAYRSTRACQLCKYEDNDSHQIVPLREAIL